MKILPILKKLLTLWRPDEASATSNTVPFCGLKVSAKELIVRRKDMQFLKKHIDGNSVKEAERKEFDKGDKGDPLAMGFDVSLYR